uniref:ShKT domain-containing protein n=1 Tax=Trichuris muris TaxID=70415 RepID=A0A5S6QIR2_TRIMR
MTGVIVLAIVTVIMVHGPAVSSTPLNECVGGMCKNVISEVQQICSTINPMKCKQKYLEYQECLQYCNNCT